MKITAKSIFISFLFLMAFNVNAGGHDWFNKLPDTYFGMKSVSIKVISIDGKEKIIKTKQGYPLIKLNHGDKIKIKNNRIGRIQAILSVDGKDPATGKKVTLGSSGKVLMPNEGDYFQYMGDAQNATGYISVAVFFEKENYPTIYPHMKTPPNEDKHFIKNGEGVKVWIPPKDYPFRKTSSSYTPDIRFYLNYEG